MKQLSVHPVTAVDKRSPSPDAFFRRSGKSLVFVAITLPVIFGITGLVVDIGLLSVDNQNLMHAADAASTAGMFTIQQGGTNAQAQANAIACIQDWNGLSNASVTVNIPPVSGNFAGVPNCLQVVASLQRATTFSQFIGIGPQAQVSVQSVASSEPSTTGAAVVVLDPSPPTLSILGLPLGIGAFPTLTGGLEVDGLGYVAVNGAVLVNNTWGATDQSGNPAGILNGLLHAISCTPIISLTRLKAQNIRVVGGVDNPLNYEAYVSGQPSPLRCNRMPVPDPFLTLPAPTVSADKVNVKSTQYGGVTVISLPLLGSTTLQPGVYDWIEVVSGNVTFQPGVYVIRNTNPLTGIGLSILTGNITANGVMFYITNSTGYDAVSGLPDSTDGETAPASNQTLSLIPSVVINAAVTLGSQFSGLSSSGSPFGGMLIYQRRLDQRPIVITHQALLGAASLQGALYAKWGNISFVGDTTYNMSFVAGTVRFVSALGMTVAPTSLLSSAYDVYLMP